MNTVAHPGQNICDSPLQQVLLAHVCHVRSSFWPGIDGLTVDIVLSSYCRAAEAGQVPNQQELLGLYPELHEQIEAFFARSKAAREHVLCETPSGITDFAIRAD